MNLEEARKALSGLGYKFTDETGAQFIRKGSIRLGSLGHYRSLEAKSSLISDQAEGVYTHRMESAVRFSSQADYENRSSNDWRNRSGLYISNMSGPFTLKDITVVNQVDAPIFCFSLSIDPELVAYWASEGYAYCFEFDIHRLLPAVVNAWPDSRRSVGGAANPCTYTDDPGFDWIEETSDSYWRKRSQFNVQKEARLVLTVPRPFPAVRDVSVSPSLLREIDLSAWTSRT